MSFHENFKSKLYLPRNLLEVTKRKLSQLAQISKAAQARRKPQVRLYPHENTKDSPTIEMEALVKGIKGITEAKIPLENPL